jgi:hypothetical protein
MRIFLFAVLLFSAFQVVGQRLENIRAEAISDGERVAVTFDITGGQEGQKFKVSLYGSHNNYSAPLQQVSGDVGEITGGRNKRMEWNAKGELGDYNGTVTFEVRADGIAPASTPLTNNSNSVPASPDKAKKKSKALFIIIPAVVVVGVVAALLLRDKKDGELPLPPEPEN